MHLLTQSAVLRALGWCLFDSCWQMAMLWILYCSIIHIYKEASAHFRHGLAMFLLGSGAAWSVATFFQAFTTPDHPGTADWISNWIAGPSAAGILTQIKQITQTILSYCSIGYLLFLSYFFIRYMGQYLHARRLKTSGLSKIAPGHRIFVEQTARRMSIHKSVGVWLSEHVDVPVTLGFIKPIILIPFATAVNLSTQQLEAILLHELAHIKRNDYLVNLGVSVLEMLFFFNPFTRLFIRDIKREREHRCDDLVMQFKYDPLDYVSALLSLASRQQTNPQWALAAAGDNDRLLLRRTRRILQLPQTRDRIGARPLFLLLGTLLVTGLIGLCLTSWNPNQLEQPQLIQVLSHLEDQLTPSSTAKRDTAGPTATTWSESGTQKIIKSTRTAAAVLPRIVIFTAKTVNNQTSPKAKQPMHVIMVANVSYSTSADTPDQPESQDPVIGKTIVDVTTEKRDFSIKTRTKAKVPAEVEITNTTQSQPKSQSETGQIESIQMTERAPYVPNASFSYNFIQDSSRPDQQFIYLQKQAAYEAASAVRKMQAELQLQLHILQITDSQEEKQVVLQKKLILEQQLKLQQEYLVRQRELLKRFEQLQSSKKGKIRRIVEI